MKRTSTIHRPSVVATINADEYARAAESTETHEFWGQVDAYEQHLREYGLDHAPAKIQLP